MPDDYYSTAVLTRFSNSPSPMRILSEEGFFDNGVKILDLKLD